MNRYQFVNLPGRKIPASISRAFTKQNKTRCSDNDAKATSFDMGQYLHLTPTRKNAIQKRVALFRDFFKPTPPPDEPNHQLAPLPDIQESSCNGSIGFPIANLPASVQLKILQHLHYEDLIPLLRVCKKIRNLILGNYHRILSYPNGITSKYEYYPLTIETPDEFESRVSQFYTALYRVTLYEDCFQVLSTELTEAYFRFWEKFRSPRLRRYYEENVLSVGCDTIRDEMLARLLGQVQRREVKRLSSLIYAERLIPATYYGTIHTDDEDDQGVADSSSVSSEAKERSLTKDNILSQGLRFAISPAVYEEVAYSFPRLNLQRLHPVQILALIMMKDPAWSWQQETQLERLRELYENSSEALREMERYRAGWQRMRVHVQQVVGMEAV